MRCCHCWCAFVAAPLSLPLVFQKCSDCLPLEPTNHLEFVNRFRLAYKGHVFTRSAAGQPDTPSAAQPAQPDALGASQPAQPEAPPAGQPAAPRAAQPAAPRAAQPAAASASQPDQPLPKVISH
ncbi:hypothetical protein RIF29_38826 [Crotalaria pallida]|uniref:Uncharacterized protein n=1 Tax=Crotalaria pallida TaxID=3830 RepID=A0AAN9E005_CROPI